MSRRTVGVGTNVRLRLMQADIRSLSRSIWRRATRTGFQIVSIEDASNVGARVADYNGKKQPPCACGAHSVSFGGGRGTVLAWPGHRCARGWRRTRSGCWTDDTEPGTAANADQVSQLRAQPSRGVQIEVQGTDPAPSLTRHSRARKRGRAETRAGRMPVPRRTFALCALSFCPPAAFGPGASPAQPPRTQG